MKVGSLFSGAGCGDLGLEWAGFEHAWFCESDEYARKILALRWPGVPIYGDIRGVDFTAVPHVDILAGGFPCQDISVAGKGAGISGERSGLWREYARAIGDIRPRYAVIENSPALVTRGLDVVLSDLAQIGYHAEWDCIPASWFGAPHRRERLWIIAYPMCFRVERSIFKEIQGIKTFQRFKNIGSLEDLRTGPAIPTPRLCRVDDAPANFLDRLRCVGNGQFPGCTYFLGRCIMNHAALMMAEG